ncbi:hypothetical protein [Streptomyces mirabilis]|uniref:hypothetical protein n=1 Tax=Streptomyces mirabilis TaxID=68239 RepID=UPI003318AEB1
MPPPTDLEVLSTLTCMRCPLSFGRRAAGGGRRTAGGTAAYVVCELADATSVRAAVDRAVSRPLPPTARKASASTPSPPVPRRPR